MGRGAGRTLRNRGARRPRGCDAADGPLLRPGGPASRTAGRRTRPPLRRAAPGAPAEGQGAAGAGDAPRLDSRGDRRREPAANGGRSCYRGRAGGTSPLFLVAPRARPRNRAQRLERLPPPVTGPDTRAGRVVPTTLPR